MPTTKRKPQQYILTLLRGEDDAVVIDISKEVFEFIEENMDNLLHYSIPKDEAYFLLLRVDGESTAKVIDIDESVFDFMDEGVDFWFVSDVEDRN